MNNNFVFKFWESYDFWLCKSIEIAFETLWNLVGTSHDTGTVITVTPTALPPHHLIMSAYHRPGILAADHSGINPLPQCSGIRLVNTPRPCLRSPWWGVPRCPSQSLSEEKSVTEQMCDDIGQRPYSKPLKGWFVGYFISLYKTSSKVNTSVHWSMASLKENVVKP